MGERARDFVHAWQECAPPVRRSIELAFVSLAHKGLAVGSVLTDAGAEIIAEGRNRAYDPAGGPEILQGTPIAHAEMNVLALARTDWEMSAFTLWTTHQPCAMCLAAAVFTEVGTVRFIAPDPWALATDQPVISSTRATRVIGPTNDVWTLCANVLYLLSIANARGPQHPTITRNHELEPETTGVLLEVYGAGLLPTTVDDFLERWWTQITEAAERRRARAGVQGRS
jgi:tRNA(Arg) A34 adenosine deaminase TadA